MAKGNLDRRQYARLKGNFVVSYRIKQLPGNYDLSQTRDVNQGGMMLTTNRIFENGTHLVMIIRLPFISKKIEILGEVVNSRKVVRNLIYETRIKFLSLDKEFFKKLGKFVEENL